MMKYEHSHFRNMTEAEMDSGSSNFGARKYVRRLAGKD
jgi:hypothetical protein